MELLDSEHYYEELFIKLNRVPTSSEPTYNVSVTSSCSGLTAEMNFVFPFSESDLEKAFTIMQRSSPKFTRGISERSSADPTRKLGESLIAALNSKEFWNVCQKSAATARERGSKLRLRFCFDDYPAAILPWEFMFGMFSQDYTSLSLSTPVVRQWGGEQMPERPLPDAPLRVLVAIAEAFPFDGGAGLETNQLEDIQNKTQRLELVGVIRDCTVEQLMKEINRTSCHVLHLIASGSDGEGWASRMNQINEAVWLRQSLKLMTEGELAERTLTSAPTEQLVASFGNNAELRLVCLSGDCTDHIAAQLTQSLPAVIGWRGTNTELAYQSFAKGLYMNLANGYPLEEAVTFGRQMIDADFRGSKEWGMPVFYMQTPGIALALRGGSGMGFVAEEILGHAGSAPPPPPPPPDDQERRREWDKLHVLLRVAQQNLKAITEETSAYSMPSEVVENQAKKIQTKIDELQDNLKKLDA